MARSSTSRRQQEGGRPARQWQDLAAGTKRRWIANSGGPRSLGHTERERRAKLAYEAGAHLAPEHTGHRERSAMGFVVAVTSGGLRRVTTSDFRQKQRLGRYARDSEWLLGNARDRNGRPLPAMSEGEFRRRWRRRVRSVHDDETGESFELEGDPRRVEAVWAVHGPEEGGEPVRGGTP